jgi:hypothetical protein
VNAGAKYWQNDVTLDYRVVLGDPPATVADGQLGTKQDLWDPMLGAKARVILSRTVHLGLSVTAGFRSFQYKRTDGEGAEELETKVHVLGPLIGVSFVF